MEKWTERVNPQIQIIEYQIFFNPFLKSEKPELIDIGFVKRFVQPKPEDLLSFRMQWSSYRNIQNSPVLDTSKDFRLQLNEWWGQREDLKTMVPFVRALFTVPLSTAQVERSFKLLRKTLPRDHSRDSMKDDLLAAEVFFAFNKKLILPMLFK